jgi:hypothetical protein
MEYTKNPVMASNGRPSFYENDDKPVDEKGFPWVFPSFWGAKTIYTVMQNISGYIYHIPVYPYYMPMVFPPYLQPTATIRRRESARPSSAARPVTTGSHFEVQVQFQMIQMALE